MTDHHPSPPKLSAARLPDKPQRDAASFLALAPEGPLLGIDPGRKRIGIAASDASRIIASPVGILVRRRWRDDLAHLRNLVETRGITGIVLGLPLNMDGSEGPRARSAWQTGINLQTGLGLPVLMCDERLSTFEAGEIIAENEDRGRHGKHWIDAVAASVILRDALDALRRTEGPTGPG
ncbi:MAG: Holliday junction resolvase RuvX [bacterium]|nr:Holliday junction resolvase RuvX [bacterium]MDE0242879.1 Holliday junction resolvase RuvX [bacterium]